ncbi:Similar to Ankyrin-3; acc. no. Q12955 [Pyronema omphalodes CBS 100304]|uniref:Similar to Ankyrin-3 acc. no. Q12955 n=1 Tax=Pyronema omphalodes (strain CBS 100304) TaxID=1076935 RepID=U4L596_PYROM|nr:Similar to Ankyrin-3; acc. no. Q12955 [Pyronema omphalodes CBS 100304]
MNTTDIIMKFVKDTASELSLNVISAYAKNPLFGLKRVYFLPSSGWHPLHYAVFLGHTIALNNLLGAENANASPPSKNKQTPLHVALDYGRGSIALLLISRGANVNATDFRGKTPLHLALSTARNDDMAKFLIENGENVNVSDRFGVTALHFAAKLQIKSMVQILLENNASPNVMDNYGRTPLHIAVILRNSDVMRILIDNKADVCAVDKDGDTPVNLAMRKGNLVHDFDLSESESSEYEYSNPESRRSKASYCTIASTVYESTGFEDPPQNKMALLLIDSGVNRVSLIRTVLHPCTGPCGKRM